MGSFGNYSTPLFPQKENVIRNPENYPQKKPHWCLHCSKSDKGSCIFI